MKSGEIYWRLDAAVSDVAGLMTMIGSWHATGFAMFSVIEKSSGRWVGRLGPWMPEGWPGPEVGWAIASRVLGARLRHRRRDRVDQLGVRSSRWIADSELGNIA